MEENQNQNTEFMKETIKQRPLNRRKLLRRTLITAAMAVVFGMVACLTFLLLEPLISNKLYPEKEPETVVLGEESEEDEILPEDMIADDSQMNVEPEESKVLEEEQIAQVLSKMELDKDDYATLYNALSEVAKGVQKSMVTVVGIKSDVDWFNNVYESEGSVSGVVVADNGVELLILTNYQAIKDAEALEILFYDNTECEAVLKKRDLGTGLAVLSVTKTAMHQSTIDVAVPVRLGTSAVSSLIGLPVIAVGQPMGVANSVCYGMITATEQLSDIPDSKYKLITTDIYGSTTATGILVNLYGQVVGVIDNGHASSNTPNLVSAIGITDLRKIIERMSNDREIPYLGIHGADVPMTVHEKLEVPFGVYVMEIDMDSPAMAAGIQSGDVITVVDEKEVSSYQELIGSLLEYDVENVIMMKVLRQGPEGYTEMELEVTLTAR